MQSPRALVFAALTLFGAPLAVARATYSIVASDTRTRQVGGAGASCVYPNQVSIIFGVAPGFGAVHAQAQANTAGRDRAAQLLSMGESPENILRSITAASFDAMAARRQYGVVDVMGRSAGFTGTQNSAFADDVQGTHDGYVYSVQGNILSGAEVLSQAESGFESGGCDLAEHLMLALEAGARNGAGDTRCTPSGIGANSAFIEVDLPGMTAGSYLKLSSGSGRNANPLPALRSAFDAWRRTHPCMRAEDAGLEAGARDAGLDAAAASVDAGRPNDAAAPSDASVQLSDASLPTFDAATPPSATFDAASPGTDAAQGPDSASAPAPSSDAALTTAIVDAAAEDDVGGCAVLAARAQRSRPGLWLLGLALLTIVRRSYVRRVSAS